MSNLFLPENKTKTLSPPRTVTRALSDLLDPEWHTLTLISARKNYIYLPASLRALVDPDFPLETVFMPYDNIFGKFPGTFIHGTVTSVEENKRTAFTTHEPGKFFSGIVVFQPDCQEKLERVHYDVLVVATGSRWEGFTGFPSETEQCIAHVEMWRMKFKSANDIVIAGGGPVGLGKRYFRLTLRKLLILFLRSGGRIERHIPSKPASESSAI